MTWWLVSNSIVKIPVTSLSQLSPSVAGSRGCCYLCLVLETTNNRWPGCSQAAATLDWLVHRRLWAVRPGNDCQSYIICSTASEVKYETLPSFYVAVTWQRAPRPLLLGWGVWLTFDVIDWYYQVIVSSPAFSRLLASPACSRHQSSALQLTFN